MRIKLGMKIQEESIYTLGHVTSPLFIKFSWIHTPTNLKVLIPPKQNIAKTPNPQKKTEIIFLCNKAEKMLMDCAYFYTSIDLK